MLAAWMLHALGVGLLLCAAGLALDRLLRPHRRPLRWIWLGVLGLAAGIPVLRLVPLDPVLRLVPFGRGAGEAAGPLPDAPVLVLEGVRPTVESGSWLHALDPVLVGAWALASLVLAGAVAAGALRLRNRGRRWKERRVAGERVLVSDAVGPAVVGVLRSAVVLPRRMLGRGEATELVLLHEREHVRAGDPRVLAAGGVVVLLFPWNPFLWWAFRRLGEAVEVDCDARVLRRRPDALERYAQTLLEAGRRRIRRSVPLPALAESRSSLERRIDAMTSPRPRRPFARGLALGTVALVAVAGACIAPDAREGGEQNNPTDVEAPDVEPRAPEVSSDRDRVEIVPDPDPGPQTSTLARQPTFTPFPVKPDIRNRREVQAALEAEYPPLLREAGIGGTALVWFFIDETGEVRNTEIRESAGHEALDHAALDVARTFEFTPAMNGDEPAPVWIALPITFTTE